MAGLLHWSCWLEPSEVSVTIIGGAAAHGPATKVLSGVVSHV